MLVKECSVIACASLLCFCVGLCAAQESSVKESVIQNPIGTAQKKEILIKVTTGSREFQVALNSQALLLSASALRIYGTFRRKRVLRQDARKDESQF